MQSVERAVYSLRRLFEQYGYKKYKMSKFEEYGLYLENKSFLSSPEIISFTDLSGRLMALKPDVTLSIAKNVPREPSGCEKVYYNEKVYRVPRGAMEYREIEQVGLECLGAIDDYSQCEVVLLAYRSLSLLSGSFVMLMSHMGFVSGLLESCALPGGLEKRILSLIEHKNAHEIIRVCDEAGLAPQKRDALAAITRLHGNVEETLEKARELVCCEAMSAALQSLEGLYSALAPHIEESAITLDFSVINDLSYYNGLIFQGFVPGVPRAVLSGGRYDNLMEKLGKRAGALGFAVYVDELERMREEDGGFDVDVLLLYGEDERSERIVRAVESLTACGESVRAQREDTGELRYKRLLSLSEGGPE